jgi:hypothetical protein
MQLLNQPLIKRHTFGRPRGQVEHHRQRRGLISLGGVEEIAASSSSAVVLPDPGTPRISSPPPSRSNTVLTDASAGGGLVSPAGVRTVIAGARTASGRRASSSLIRISWASDWSSTLVIQR